MSRENVELVRDLTRAFNTRDIQAMLARSRRTPSWALLLRGTSTAGEWGTG
jgi:hypothetical protein